MPSPRHDSSSVLLDGEIYIIGGMTYIPRGGIDRVDVYDPTRNTWRQETNLPEKIGNYSEAVTLNNKIYVIGGEETDASPPSMVSKVRIFDPLTKAWTYGPSLQTARFWFGCTVLNQKIYVFGGWSPDGYALDSIEVFDPCKNQWEYVNSKLTGPRDRLEAVSLNNAIYLMGGNATEGGESLNLVERGTAGRAVDNYVWVTNWFDSSVTRINKSNLNDQTDISVWSTPNGIAVDGLYVWVTHHWQRKVTRITKSDLSVRYIDVGYGSQAPAVDDRYVWVPNQNDNTVTRIDKETLTTETIDVQQGPFDVAVDETYAWVGSCYQNIIVRINRFDTSQKQFFALPGQGSTDSISVDRDYLWVFGEPNAVVSRLKKPDLTDRIDLSMPYGNSFGAVDDSHVWVANFSDAKVTKIDKTSLSIDQVIDVAVRPVAIGLDDSFVWVSHYEGNAMSKISKSDSTLTSFVAGDGGRHTSAGDMTGYNFDRFFLQYCLSVIVKGDSDGGAVSPPCQTVSYGGTATFTVTTNPGYAAAVSEGTLSGGTWTIPNITSSKAVTVKFTRIPNMVTVKLLQSNGNPISGGVVQYYSGSWKVFGTTDANGQVTQAIVPSGNYTFRMNYLGGNQDKQQNTATDPIVTYRTVGVAVQLKDSAGNFLDPGTVKFYSDSWRDFGPTSGGQVSKELLPLTYTFRMNYLGGSQDKQQNTSSSPVVAYQTVNVTAQLKDSTGNFLDPGTVKFYSDSWRDFGATSGGQVSKELLPLTYTFRMNYLGGSQDKQQNTSSSPVVAYQTVNVTAQLKDSTGNFLDPGTVKFYSDSWRDFGPTSGGQVSKELLPLTYTFRMTYLGGNQDKQQNTSSSPVIAYQTVSVTAQLKDSAGNFLDPGTVKFYSDSWRDFGPTSGGQVSKELLPLTYTFRMNYLGGNQDKQQNTSSNPVVAYQTVNVTAQLKDSAGNFLDPGTMKFYSDSWRDFGPTSGGQVSKELLPLTYTFRMNYLGGNQDKQQNTLSVSTVPFQTGQIHSDSGTCTSFYSDRWRSFVQDMQLLPVAYTFRFNDGTADKQYTIVSGTVNHVH